MKANIYITSFVIIFEQILVNIWRLFLQKSFRNTLNNAYQPSYFSAARVKHAPFLFRGIIIFILQNTCSSLLDPERRKIYKYFIIFFVTQKCAYKSKFKNDWFIDNFKKALIWNVSFKKRMTQFFIKSRLF